MFEITIKNEIKQFVLDIKTFKYLLFAIIIVFYTGLLGKICAFFNYQKIYEGNLEVISQIFSGFQKNILLEKNILVKGALGA
jgi:hypothetical protein